MRTIEPNDSGKGRRTARRCRYRAARNSERHHDQMRRPEFNAEEHLIRIVENGRAQLARLPAERHADAAGFFLRVFQGASGALVAAGLLSQADAIDIEGRTTGPLLAAGGLQRVETRFEASIKVAAASTASSAAQAPARAATAPVRFQFDVSVHGLPGVGDEAHARATTAITDALESAVRETVKRHGGTVGSLGWTVG
jgi:hypothetical protein